MSEIVELRMTCVGRPSVLGTNRQGEVISGIRKHRVTAPEVVVRTLNIDGDGQADLRVHGGVDKAIYCYPFEHLAFWRDRLPDLRPEAPFGENLSTLGVDESTVCIGDRWRWGTALLEVSQPRWPCYKLAMHTDHPMIVKEFVAAGRSGWYLRVIEEGLASTTGSIAIQSVDPERITVAQAFSVARGEADEELFARVNNHPALAEAWRR